MLISFFFYCIIFTTTFLQFLQHKIAFIFYSIINIMYSHITNALFSSFDITQRIFAEICSIYASNWNIIINLLILIIIHLPLIVISYIANNVTHMHV